MFCLAVPSPHPLQLHITVSPEKVKLNVDCQEVAEKPVKEANNITLDGYEVLGKMVKSGGGRRSATVSEKDSAHYVFTAPADCWRAGSLRVSGRLRVSLLSLFNSMCFHCEWEPFVTPFNLSLPLPLCKVPAPDVRYYLQPELDQPRQMLRPAGHSESSQHAVFSTTVVILSCC